jgi:hypothetical protein
MVQRVLVARKTENGQSSLCFLPYGAGDAREGVVYDGSITLLPQLKVTRYVIFFERSKTLTLKGDKS